MDRANHYEAAFEAYLQQQRLCYIAVDESRRSLLDEGTVKSLDFVVYAGDESKLLGGREGPALSGRPTTDKARRVWQCWTERADVEGLEPLGGAFRRPEFVGLLVFAYHIVPPFELPADTPDLWEWDGRRYLFRAIAADVYRRHSRVRSPSWDTVDLPGRAFFGNSCGHSVPLPRPLGPALPSKRA